MATSDDIDNLNRLRMNVSKLFSVAKYYEVYIQSQSAPGLFSALLQEISTHLNSTIPDDRELVRLIECVTDKKNLLNEEEFKALSESLVRACISLVNRQVKTATKP